MKDLIGLKLNKLLLLVRKKKKIFVVVILLAVLLVGTIIKVQYYHKDFLIREVLINQYFNITMSSEFGWAYSFLCEAWEEKDCEEFFEALGRICGLIIISPLYTFVARLEMIFEEQKVPLLKKHKVYGVMSRIPYRRPPYGFHTLVINTHNLKRYWLGVNGTSYLPIQKAIKNFNEIITTERISINSYEDCVELVKTLVKLTCGCDYKYLILDEKDEFTTTVFSYEKGWEERREIKYRVKSLFIFKPACKNYYYVELHIGEQKKWTFKVKKNGVVYDFNAVDFFVPPL